MVPNGRHVDFLQSSLSATHSPTSSNRSEVWKFVPWSDGIKAELFGSVVPTAVEHDAALLPSARRNVAHLLVATSKEDC